MLLTNCLNTETASLYLNRDCVRQFHEREPELSSGALIRQFEDLLKPEQYASNVHRVMVEESQFAELWVSSVTVQCLCACRSEPVPPAPVQAAQSQASCWPVCGVVPVAAVNRSAADELRRARTARSAAHARDAEGRTLCPPPPHTTPRTPLARAGSNSDAATCSRATHPLSTGGGAVSSDSQRTPASSRCARRSRRVSGLRLPHRLQIRPNEGSAEGFRRADANEERLRTSIRRLLTAE